MKITLRIALILGVLVLIYQLGPRVDFSKVDRPEISDELDMSMDSLDQWVKVREANLNYLKPDNQSRIIWADSLRRTKYSIVYLHGFSASPMESGTLPIELASEYGFNIYMPLLPGHGLDDPESFFELQPNDLVKAAKEAIQIGQLLGEDVIVMSCSTGSTLAIYLAGANPELIDAMIMYSPNISLFDDRSKLLLGPWGEQLLKVILGDYKLPTKDWGSEGKQYWTTTYRSEGLLALQSLIEQTMTEAIFEKVSQPYLAGYYFKNEEAMDSTISISAILDFNTKTVTDASLKRLVAFPEAGEHVISNPLKSRSSAEVSLATRKFMDEVLNLTPVN